MIVGYLPKSTTDSVNENNIKLMFSIRRLKAKRDSLTD